MKEKGERLILLVLGALVAGLALWCWLGPHREYSRSEERILADIPQATWGNVTTGRFAEHCENVARDQFPLRNMFRDIKIGTSLSVLQRQDMDGVYEKDGWAAVQEVLHPEMVDHAIDCFQGVYEDFFKGTDARVYFAMVPDKHFFLGNGRPTMDYQDLYRRMEAALPDMQCLDLTEELCLEDYYRTDSHWRQERILDIADRLADTMGVTLDQTYQKQLLNRPFSGIYSITLGNTLKPESLYYLTSPTLEACTVTMTDITGAPVRRHIYDLARAMERYPYSIFLSGPRGLITIENLRAKEDRDLILFRDSFGSSLAPLLVSGYRTITMVDLRYLPSVNLDRFLQVEDQDVLFLYSTLLLNKSMALR